MTRLITPRQIHRPLRTGVWPEPQLLDHHILLAESHLLGPLSLHQEPRPLDLRALLVKAHLLSLLNLQQEPHPLDHRALLVKAHLLSRLLPREQRGLIRQSFRFQICPLKRLSFSTGAHYPLRVILWSVVHPSVRVILPIEASTLNRPILAEKASQLDLLVPGTPPVPCSILPPER
jgi:hypothetical protein